jgi:hypothetical protein
MPGLPLYGRGTEGEAPYISFSWEKEMKDEAFSPNFNA